MAVKKDLYRGVNKKNKKLLTKEHTVIIHELTQEYPDPYYILCESKRT